MNKKTLTTIIGLILVIATLVIFYEKQDVQPKTPVYQFEQGIVIGPPLVKEKINVKQVESWIETLPDSSFKSNLYIVFGAEYGGDSEELNKLLKAFLEIRIQELTKEKKI